MSRAVFEIISFPLVERLRRDGILLSFAQCRLYPDGSLRAVGHTLGDQIRQLTHKEGSHYGVCHFRPLAPLGDQQYTITWPGWYEIMLSRFDESGIIFMPNFSKPTDAENNLSRVRVKVELHRKFTPQIAKSLASAISSWFQEIGAVGVFGEAGISSISPQLLSL
jgi:hypothetical protein